MSPGKQIQRRPVWPTALGVAVYVVLSIIVMAFSAPSVAGDGNVSSGLSTYVMIINIVAAVVLGGIAYLRMRKNAITAGVIVAVAVFTGLSAITWCVEAISKTVVEYWWFANMGQADVFLTPLWWRIGLWIVGTVLTLTALLGVNEACPLPIRPKVPDTVDILDSLENSDTMRLANWVVMVLGTLFGGLTLSGMTDRILPFVNRVPFGDAINDKVFGMDTSFYMWELPLFSAIRVWLIFLIATAAVLLAVRATFHHLNGSMESIKERVFNGFGLLALLYIVVGIAGMYFAPFELVFKAHDHYTGAGFTDVLVRIPLMRVMPILSFVATGVAVFALFKGRFGLLSFAALTPIIASVLISSDAYVMVLIFWLVISAFIIGVVDLIMGKKKPSLGRMAGIAFGALVFCHVFGWPSVTQTFMVGPEQLVKEKPYIAEHLAATKRAYGIDSVQTQDYPYTPVLSDEDYRSNEASLAQARVQDWSAVAAYANDQKEGQTFYDFSDTDLIFTPGGTVMSAVREINPGSLQNRSWSNVHLQFPCGLGWVVASATETNRDGSPQFIVDNVPMTGDQSLIPAKPGVCFGEIPNNWVIANTLMDEEGNPSGVAGKPHYDGTGGLQIGSGLRRFIIAVALDDYRVLISSQITPESRLFIHRRPLDQLRLLAPFIAWDNDPFAVNGGQQLVWMTDGASIGSNFPYALAQGGFNENDGRSFSYLRASVKATLGAYNGDLSLYAQDENEPVLATWRRVYPSLFRPAAEMPQELRAQVRYPEDVFNVQVRVFQNYHVDSPDSLYNTDNVWLVPSEAYNDATAPVPARYMTVRLPGGEANEPVLAIPLNQSGKENGQVVSKSILRAYLVVRMGTRYGQFAAWTMPQGVSVVSTEQVQGYIDTYLTRTGQPTFKPSQNGMLRWGNQIMVPVMSADGSAASFVYIKPQFEFRTGNTKVPFLVKAYTVRPDGLTTDGSNLNIALTRFLRGEGVASADTGASATTTAPAVNPVDSGTTQPATAPTGDCAALIDQLNVAISRQQAGDKTAAAEIARIGLEVGLKCGE
ncbi:COG1615 family transporter [candidate division WWE3 bacterium]|nr:COG1615 family transporter [candidate division WWE3 bacterium]